MVKRQSCFQKYGNEFRIFVKKSEESVGLRKCQAGALWALKAYFVVDSNIEKPAIVSMPTGSGKTAVMIAACFELRASKVLVVEPSGILRDQVAEQFENLEILKKNGCFNDCLEQKLKVKVYKVTKEHSKEDWKKIIYNYDVFIAHPRTVSPYYENVSLQPSDFFDLIIVDEAHHEPAESWRELLKHFPKRYSLLRHHLEETNN